MACLFSSIQNLLTDNTLLKKIKKNLKQDPSSSLNANNTASGLIPTIYCRLFLANFCFSCVFFSQRLAEKAFPNEEDNPDLVGLVGAFNGPFYRSDPISKSFMVGESGIEDASAI